MIVELGARVDPVARADVAFRQRGGTMRISVAGILWLGSLACVAQVPQTDVQQSQPLHSPSPTQYGGVREVLESIVIPPMPHAPFSATLATESTKYTADGASMTYVNERHIARDAQGRIYEERWLLVPKNGKIKSIMNWIQLADPHQRRLYNCSPQRHICDLLVYDPASDLAAASPKRGKPGTTPHEDGSTVWEDLGARSIAGVEPLTSAGN